MPFADRLPVAIIGSGDAQLPEEDQTAAIEVGRALAERRYVLVCGGRNGVMAAAAEGCARAGGLCIGILPTLETTPNPACSVIIPTDLGSADNEICKNVSRNRVLIRSALCVFAISGGRGTANELRFAWDGGKRVFGLGRRQDPEGYTAAQTWDESSRRFQHYKTVAAAMEAFDAFVGDRSTFATMPLLPRKS